MVKNTYNIPKIIDEWLNDRFVAYINMGIDDWADDFDDYAVEQMEEYSNNPPDIIGDYLEEVIAAFSGDTQFVTTNRAEIDQAVTDWYRENKY